ncbi:MAG: hypothetical protein FWD68_19035 [Alphaproteobacteria bacterium]|nr:hypothetical protein [Alphaproteobacteria bacterium]
MNFVQIVWKIATGFIVAAVILYAPAVLILYPIFGPLIIGATFPVWSVVIVPIVFLRFLATRQFYKAIGAAILFINFFVYPSEWPGGMYSSYIRDNIIDFVDLVSFVRVPFQHIATEAECSNGHTELMRPSVKPTRLIIDSQDKIVNGGFGGFDGYDPIKLAAALAKVEVIEIIRNEGVTQRFVGAWATTAIPLNPACDGSGASHIGDNTLKPRSWSPGSPETIKTDVCFKFTEVPDPSQDASPAIVLRADPTIGKRCLAIDVFERTSHGDALLGKMRYYRENGSVHSYPELRRDQGASWFRALLSKVLGTDTDPDNATIIRLLVEPIAEKWRSVLRQALKSHNFDAAAVKAGADFFRGIAPNRKIEGEDIDIARLLLTDERFPVPALARNAVLYTKNAPPDYFDAIGAAMFERLRAIASSNEEKRGSSGDDPYYIADVISVLPGDTIRKHHGDLEWLTKQRVRPPLAMQRLAVFGASAAQTFLWLIDDSQRFISKWSKSDWENPYSGGLIGLCKLGREGAEMIPRIYDRIDSGVIPLDRYRILLVNSLISMGAEPEDIWRHIEKSTASDKNAKIDDDRRRFDSTVLSAQKKIDCYNSH